MARLSLEESEDDDMADWLGAEEDENVEFAIKMTRALGGGDSHLEHLRHMEENLNRISLKVVPSDEFRKIALELASQAPSFESFYALLKKDMDAKKALEIKRTPKDCDELLDDPRRPFALRGALCNLIRCYKSPSLEDLNDLSHIWYEDFLKRDPPRRPEMDPDYVFPGMAERVTEEEAAMKARREGQKELHRLKGKSMEHQYSSGTLAVIQEPNAGSSTEPRFDTPDQK